MWQGVEAAPADSIFGLTEAFKNDPNPKKVNLGVGVYADDEGNTPVLQCVREAEKLLFTEEVSKNYLPITGASAYSRCVQKLLFGEDSKVIREKRAITAHTPGGTGALRIGAELLKKCKGSVTIWVSSPTWTNHTGIFTSAGFEVKSYPYYDAATKGLDVQSFLAGLKKIPAGDVVLLHACCHNPSGVDPSAEQWKEVTETARACGWFPFLDFAYQGFGDGLEEDRYVVELMAEAGIDCFIASSFSKNFGLYNERTGALTVVSPSLDDVQIALSHLKTVVRVAYSNPPAHGGLIIAKVLSDPSLKEMWTAELAAMRRRIVEIRRAFAFGLKERGVDTDFSYIVEQKGMFSFSGLSEEIVDQLRERYSIYVVDGGRINVAGLTFANIHYVCDAVANLLK